MDAQLEDAFDYNDSGNAVAMTEKGGYTDKNSAAGWTNRGLKLNVNPMRIYTAGRYAGAATTNWDYYAADKLAAIKPRINVSHLMDPAFHHKTPVKFLRAGKQWGLIIG